MSKTTSKKLTDAAFEAVAALEATDVGEDAATAITDAEQAVASLRDFAVAQVFPSTPVPVGADLQADVDHYTSRIPDGEYGPVAARLHGEALDAHPELAAQLRHQRFVDRVRDAAARRAAVVAPDRDDRQPFVDEYVGRYQRTVAAQLQDRGELEPYAGVIADELPTLEERLAAARDQHVAAAAELRAAAATEAADRQAQIRDEFRRVPGGCRFMHPDIRRGFQTSAKEVVEMLADPVPERVLAACEAELAAYRKDIEQQRIGGRIPA